MKSSFFAFFGAALLLAGSGASAVPTSNSTVLHAAQQNPGDRDFNYGYSKRPKLTAQEKARWEAEHRNDRRNDRDRHDDNDRDKNYGYDRSHRVTPEERRKWEEAHNYGYAKDHQVTTQERKRWEAQYRR